MRDVHLINCACADYSNIEHTDSSDIGIGILNHECAVLPPSSSSAAIHSMSQLELFCQHIEHLIGQSLSGMFSHTHLEH